MKHKTKISILVILTGLFVLGGIALSAVKAQAPVNEETLPQPQVTSRFEQRAQMRADRQAQRQFQSEDCVCVDLSAEECEALRVEHRLARLDERLAQGLITQEHYNVIRAKIEAGEQPPYGLRDGSGQGLGAQGQGAGQGNGQGSGLGQGMRRGQGQGQGLGQGQGQGTGQGTGRRGQQNNGDCPYIP